MFLYSCSKLTHIISHQSDIITLDLEEGIEVLEI